METDQSDTDDLDSTQSILRQLQDAAVTERTDSALPWGILLQCVEYGNTIEAVASIKKFGGVLKKLDLLSDELQNDVSCCIDILARLFTEVEPKSPLSRAISSLLQGFPHNLHPQIENKLKEHLVYQLNSTGKDNAQSLVGKVHLITAYMVNFSVGEKCLESCLDTVFEFLIMTALQEFHQSTRMSSSAANQTEMMQSCLATIKTTMSVIQKFSNVISKQLVSGDSSCKLYLERFIELNWNTLANDIFISDLRSATGMAIPLVWKVFSGDECLANKIYDELGGGKVVEGHMQRDPSSSKSPLTLDELCPSSHLYLYHGVLAMVKVKDLLQCVDINRQPGCLLLDVILPKIFDLTERLKDCGATLAASRTLTLWTTVAVSALSQEAVNPDINRALMGSGPISQKLLQYVWTHWDHPVDGMRHQTRMIFENAIAMHVHSVPTDLIKDDPFLLKILQDLMSVSWHVRGKYGPLGCLVQHLGTDRMMELYPTMHHTLLDMSCEQTLVPYACELLSKLFINHHQDLMTSLIGKQGTGLIRWQQTWILPTLTLLCNPLKTKQHKGFLVEYHLPKLLKFSPESLPYITEHLQDSDHAVSSDQLGALLICLKTARTLGLIKTGQTDNGDLWKGLVSLNVLEQALCHSNSQVQLNTLGLLCDSNKTTESFSRDELRLVACFLSYNMNSSSPSFRQQMCSHLKKMLIRLRESGRVLHKKTTTPVKMKSSKDNQEISAFASQISTYKEFVEWFYNLQFTNLEPGASYPRRATALQILTMVVQIFNGNKQGKHPTLFNPQDMWTPSHVQLVMMRLTDNYESNKVMAFDLLNDLSQETLGLLNTDDLESMYTCSLELACSNKPHSCESASYMLRVLARQMQQPVKMAATCQEQCIIGIIEDLCKELQKQIHVAKESLLEACVKAPMYGVLHCIRELLSDVQFSSVSSSQEWKKVLDTIIGLCFDVAKIASIVVCNSSPEGYIPNENSNDSTSDDLELYDKEESDMESEDTKWSDEVVTFQVTPQMVLVCCWRGMKEVSLLLGQLSLDVPVCDNDQENDGLITEKKIVAIGELFLRLLKESKHRGAFELAYVGFIKLCTKLWRSETRSLCQLPELWLEGLMNDVTSDQPMLCATRRSAGIPFAIQALLNSEPASLSKQHLKSVMSRLLNLALSDTSDGLVSSTSKVHALNILRALYRDTHHGEDVFPYVADGVRAAILGFQAQLWAVRNSATMLFSALITRIFGVKRGKEEHARKNCMTGREFFSRFPSLHTFLLSQLEEAVPKINSSTKAQLHPALFPVMLLLSRLYPSAMDGSDSSLSMAVFVPHVLRCAGTSVFKTRCIAARALVAVVPIGNVAKILKQLLETLPKDHDMRPICHNYIHGVLLQVQNLLSEHLAGSSVLSRSHDVTANIADILPQLPDSLWLATRYNPCYVTRAAMLTIINAFILDQTWVDSSDKTSMGHSRLQKCDWTCITDTKMDDEHDTKLPGYIDWQIAHAQFCLKISNMAELENNPLCSENRTDIGIVNNFTKSCTISNNQSDLRQAKSDSKNPSRKTSESSESGEQKMDRYHICSTVLSLLSSPQYEVYELVLVTLLEESEILPRDPQHTNIWSKVNHSEDIFQVLVTMVINEAEDSHPACIEKVLSLLSIHPHSKMFPWKLKSGKVMDCLDVFNKIVAIALLHINARADTTCAALRLLAAIFPSLYAEIRTGKMNEDVSKALSDWATILESCSQPECSIQSRALVASIISNLAGEMLVDLRQVLGFDVPMRLWGVVMSLLQDDDTGVQAAACHCIQQALKSLPSHVSISGALPATEFQSTLGLKIGLSIMTRLYADACPRQYLQTLTGWLVADGDDIDDSSSFPANKEQIPEDRLFDRGEANTNFESLLFGKAILKELVDSMTKPNTTIQASINTDHKEAQCHTDPTDDQPTLIGVADQSTSAAAEGTPGIAIDCDKPNQTVNHLRNYEGFDLHRGVCPPSLENISAESKQDLKTTAQALVDKSLLTLEHFLDSISDVNLTTPYLDTSDFETNCMKCWGLLASIQGLVSLGKVQVTGQMEDDFSKRMLQVMQLVVAKFGGQQHCNSLIYEAVRSIEQVFKGK